MKTRAIVIVRDGQEQLYPIKAEKMVIGRDKSSDIVLDDVSVSRKHAAIVCRFEKVYVENLSPSGQVLKGEAPVEYAELEEDMDVNIGPYMIQWRFVDDSAFAAPRKGEPAQDVSAPLNDAEAVDSVSDAQLADAPVDVGMDVNAIQPYDGDMMIGAGDAGLSPISEEISANENTVVSQQQALPKLRIVRGEGEGREIKLDIGSVWVVGRSRKAHIHLESEKLSRQHFKIIKINNRYRIQDMGSATGTKLNGVTVADAPLQPFDTILAGNIELQFVLVDSAFQHVGVPQLGGATPQLAAPEFPQDAAASAGAFDDVHKNSTIVNVPVPYDPRAASQGFASTSAPGESSHAAFASSEASSEEESEDGKKTHPLLRKVRAKYAEFKTVWYELPKQKRILYGSLGAVMLLLVLSSLVGSSEGTHAPAAATTASEKEEGAATAINVAQSPDISPTFYALSIDKQNQITKLYADAERAIAKGEWQVAFDSTSKILDIVDKYKKSKDMLLQAQSNLTDAMFSKISPGVEDAEQAARSNRDQVNNFLASGTQALGEKRWSDAEAAFTSALTLEPGNKEAALGLNAARQKNPLAQLNEEEVVQAPVDPDLEAKQKELDLIESYRVQYQVAEDKVRAAEYHEAVPILEELYKKLNEKSDDYQAGRAPASIKSELSLAVKALQSNVQEAYESAFAQLDVEYGTQLADADQFIANRQYVQAREIYDQIIERAPYYYKVKDARDRLYEKILSEAKGLYQGALIYESVGDLRSATAGLQKTKELLENVRRYEAVEYRQKAEARLRYLKR
jgi:pSer/pThr/pTyr-binding forkhead associated (FHA) protein